MQVFLGREPILPDFQPDQGSSPAPSFRIVRKDSLGRTTYCSGYASRSVAVQVLATEVARSHGYGRSQREREACIYEIDANGGIDIEGTSYRIERA